MYPDSRKGDNIEVQIEKRGKMVSFTMFFFENICNV